MVLNGEEYALRPLASLTARLHLRYFERDNRTDYVAFNPLANDYGHVAEDGRFGVDGHVVLYRNERSVSFFMPHSGAAAQ